MLSRLLKYLVDRSVDGQADDLKEYSVGVDVFDRGAGFDPRTDTIVRVQARRLRAKLDAYYATEGRSDPLILRIPKGRYLVEWDRAPTSAAAESVHPATAASRDVSRPATQSDIEALSSDRGLIAVLPFVNVSHEASDEFFSDGLTEEVISTLASVPELRVVARTSAFQFKGRGDDVRRIGRDLGVRTVLEGSVRKEGTRIRATAQLIDVADGFHLWTQTYDRELTDVFSLQADITHAIVDALRVQLRGRTPRAPRIPEPDAYEWYLKGRHFYHKATPPALETSAECMERAIACDRYYAAAYAGLADAYLTWMSLAVQRPPAELIAKARSAATFALEVDPNSAEARCSLGEVIAFADWDFAAAEVEFRQAVALKPSFVHARMAYSITCLSPAGRHDEAIEQLREALRADPMSVLLRVMLGQAFVLAGAPDPAIAELRRALEWEPDYLFGQCTLALAYLAKSCHQDALDVLLAVTEPAEASSYAGHLGYTHARLGHRDEAGHILNGLLQRPWVPGVDVAAVYNALGQPRRAVEWLVRARQAREFDALFVRNDPRLQNLLADARVRRAYSW